MNDFNNKENLEALIYGLGCLAASSEVRVVDISIVGRQVTLEVKAADRTYKAALTLMGWSEKK